MALDNNIDKLKVLTGETDEELLALLLSDAEDYVKAYTGRTELVSGLQRAVRDLAVIALNRMGTEGESGRSEGGESYSFDDVPKHVTDVLNRYRLAKVGGKRYETSS